MSTPSDRVAAARGEAREALRQAAEARREATRQRDEARADLVRLVAAAVDGIETLAETAAAHLEAAPLAREAVGIAADGAWERLGSAGVRLDGEKGETVDLGRHRVVKRLGAEGDGRDVVVEVLSRGVVYGGTRVRPAAVVARRTDGSDRD